MHSGHSEDKVITIGRDSSVNHLIAPLRRFLNEDGVTEVCVNRTGEVFVEKDNVWQRHDVPELDLHRLKSIGVAVAAFTRNEVSDVNPILSAVLPPPGRERMQVVMPPACEEGTISITLRKPGLAMRTLAQYEAENFFSFVKPITNDLSPDEQELLALKESGKYLQFLLRAVELEKVIVIAGATGSGKTTFMKALMQSIPTTQRIITIEDVPELFLPNHPNHVHLFYPSEAKATDGAPVTASTLLKSCLRMKPNRILLAELRGGETFDFINVCSSGHGGSITSVHAGSAQLAFARMANMTMQSEYGLQLPRAVIEQLLYLLVDVVLHVSNDPHGHGRHITELWYEPMRKRQETTTDGTNALQALDAINQTRAEVTQLRDDVSKLRTEMTELESRLFRAGR
jgi:type IV secretion system protein VirB11